MRKEPLMTDQSSCVGTTRSLDRSRKSFSAYQKRQSTFEPLDPEYERELINIINDTSKRLGL